MESTMWEVFTYKKTGAVSSKKDNLGGGELLRDIPIL